MPEQSAEDAADELDDLATAPASSTNDSGNNTERSAEDVIRLRQLAKATRAMEGTNGNGGAKSGWRMLRPGKWIPPGPI